MCINCRQCPAGQYPSSLCDGRSFADSVQCTPCRTSCPAGQYLKGNCAVEEVKCVSCSLPCANVSQYLRESQACTSAGDRVCEPVTKCKVSVAPWTCKATAPAYLVVLDCYWSRNLHAPLVSTRHFRAQTKRGPSTAKSALPARLGSTRSWRATTPRTPCANIAPASAPMGTCNPA